MRTKTEESGDVENEEKIKFATGAYCVNERSFLDKQMCENHVEISTRRYKLGSG